jgi:CheY-like chemotaxis protein
MLQPTIEFRRRVLFVDNDQRFLDECSEALGKVGYEVLRASDGFEALCVLRGAIPDLLITELNLPRMSGFELLSVIRARFPQIAVIAISADYTPLTVPNETIADTFIAKGPNAKFELLETARKLVIQSPIRGSKAKPPFAVAWITTSPSGYVILTCPECLRSFSIEQRSPSDASTQESCTFCGAEVVFCMLSSGEDKTPAVRPPTSGEQRLRRSLKALDSSRDTLSATDEILRRHKRSR